MPNYQKGRIYKIVCNESGLIYIGSTVQGLAQRMAEHRHRFRNNILECSSRRVLENNNYTVTLLEKYPCNDIEELHTREQFHIDNTQNCINCKNALTWKIRIREDDEI
jgi:hypothetical protein